jgi:cephalosporin hydroxylase
MPYERRAGDTDSELPPKVEVELTDPVHTLWRRRAAQHTKDWYAGVKLAKFPEDLRAYEHLLWASRADVVIELGTSWGASALWFADRLLALEAHGRIERGRVISVDLHTGPAAEAVAGAGRVHGEMITLIAADVCDPDLPARVQELIPAGSRCLVVEDSAHVYETTMAALRGFAMFVPVNVFFVVEDGCVDIEEMRLTEDWPRGVLPALRDWLQTDEGQAFRVRRDLELYGISCHHGGFLQRGTADRYRRGASTGTPTS